MPAAPNEKKAVERAARESALREAPRNAAAADETCHPSSAAVNDETRHPSSAAVKAGLSLTEMDIHDSSMPSHSRVSPAAVAGSLGGCSSAGGSPYRSPSCGVLPVIAAVPGSGRSAGGLASSASVAVLPTYYKKSSYGTPAPVAAASGGARLGLIASQSTAELTTAPPTYMYSPRGMYGGMRAGSCANLTGLREPVGFK